MFDDGPRDAGRHALLHQLLRARLRQSEALTAFAHEPPRVTSTRLIGRAAELAELEAALADAADERPSIVFVAGESGVGKSRLLAELERQATEGGALVLAGDCVDLGESELPYVPLVAALRPLARSGDPALTEPVRAAVAPLLPGLAPRRPGGARTAPRRGCSRACCRCSTRSASSARCCS